MDINSKSDIINKVRINNGQRPPRTSSRPIRSDRMITKSLSTSSIRVKNKQQDKNKEIKPRNPPPRPKIPPPSPKPLINYSRLSYSRHSDNNNKNNEKIKKRWCEYNENDPLPKLPINWI